MTKEIKPPRKLDAETAYEVRKKLPEVWEKIENLIQETKDVVVTKKEEK